MPSASTSIASNDSPSGSVVPPTGDCTTACVLTRKKRKTRTTRTLARDMKRWTFSLLVDFLVFGRRLWHEWAVLFCARARPLYPFFLFFLSQWIIRRIDSCHHRGEVRTRKMPSRTNGGVWSYLFVRPRFPSSRVWPSVCRRPPWRALFLCYFYSSFISRARTQ